MTASEPTGSWSCARCSWRNLAMDAQCVECGVVRAEGEVGSHDLGPIPLELADSSDAARAAQISRAQDNIKPGTTTFPQAMAQGFVRDEASSPPAPREYARLTVTVVGVVVLAAIIMAVFRG